MCVAQYIVKLFTYEYVAMYVTYMYVYCSLSIQMCAARVQWNICSSRLSWWSYESDRHTCHTKISMTQDILND